MSIERETVNGEDECGTDVIAAVPPADDADAADDVNTSLTPAQESGRTPSRSQAAQLMELVEHEDLFHTSDGKAFVTLKIKQHRETYAVASEEFRTNLLARFYGRHHRVPTANTIESALGLTAGKALFEGPERKVFLRVAESEGDIFLDLGNKEWDVVRVDRSGWSVVKGPPVRFRRSPGMTALPIPQPGGSIDDLRPFVNLPEDDDWILFVATLVAALRPTGPYPILEVLGGQGSGKTTLVRITQKLVDPSTALVRGEPLGIRNLMIAAENSWVLNFDNLSKIPWWLSDAFCRLSTGGGFATRQLYANTTEVLIDVQRPVILNGISELVLRGDLLDRTITLELPAVAPSDRRAEGEFWSAFDVARPGVLGALLDAVSQGLKRQSEVQVLELPRLADFAIFVTAAEPALGWEKGPFLAAYKGNRQDAHNRAVDADDVGLAIRRFLEKQEEWCGTATELLSKLIFIRSDVGRINPQTLSNKLKRLVPDLEAEDISVRFFRSGHGGTRLIELKRMKTIVSVVSASAEELTDADL